MAVQIILKSSSIEDKRPSAAQLATGEISLNYSSAGAFLCCEDTDGNVQQVGGVKIDEYGPDAPVKQTLWFKPSTLTLFVFDGDKWLPVGAGGGGGGGGGGDINQIIGSDGIDADTVAGIVTLDIELAGGDDGLEFKTSKLSATLASATDLGSVKVGENINVTAGKISVPKADTSVFGVVKIGDGLYIKGDGTLNVDVPQTTTYRGSCDLNNSPTGQLNPDPAEKGDAYINSAATADIDAGWTPLTGAANVGDLVIFDGTDWELIPLGSGSAPVTSVNTKTGDVVLDYTDVGAASAAQGDLADTALQPGDNISELVNDEGYIKAAEAPVLSVNTKTGTVVLDAADVGALAPGDNVSELVNDAGYITLAEVPDQEPPVIISATAPTGADAVEGNLWFNSNDGRTYIYYTDGDSSQWVDASPDSGGAGGTVGDYWLEAGGYLSPKTSTNGVDIGGSKIQLNADGTLKVGDGRGEFTVFPTGSTRIERKEASPSTAPALRITNNGDENAVIYADGSITAAGTFLNGSFNSTLDKKGNRLNGTGGIFAQKESSENPTANLFGGYYGSTKTFEVQSDGSATFARDIQSTSQNGGQLAGFRNQFINGDLTQWQRGTSAYASGGSVFRYDSADRFGLFADLSSLSMGRGGTTNTPANGEFSYSISLDPGATSMGQHIELLASNPFRNGTTWTVSVYANQPIQFFCREQPSLTIFQNWTSMTASTSADANGFIRYTHTFSLSADCDTGLGYLEVLFKVPGSTLAYLTGFQFESGPQATPFEHRPIQTELALCRRYYDTDTVSGLLINANAATSEVNLFPPNVDLKNFRVNPSITNSTNDSKLAYSDGRFIGGGSPSLYDGFLTITNVTTGGIKLARLNSTDTSNIVTICGTSANSEGSPVLEFDAEL